MTITGYACACPDATAPDRPAMVLDPFGGTGTTALSPPCSAVPASASTAAPTTAASPVAHHDPAERARAMQVAKPPPVPDGQPSLFDLEAG